jgi:hypothetical protein
LAALKQQYWRPAAIPYPKENPYGRAKGELGRALFFDPILSGARVDPAPPVITPACHGAMESRERRATAWRHGARHRPASS